MKLHVFSAKGYDKFFLSRVNDEQHPHVKIVFHEFSLTRDTVSLARGADAVCTVSVNLFDCY